MTTDPLRLWGPEQSSVERGSWRR